MSLLTGSANYIKYTLFAFNLVFVITGIVLISVGVGVASVFDEYEVFLVPKFFSIPTFLIVIGSFIFVIAFFGCCGAVKENYCMILTFSILLGIIFILELSAGISGYVLRSDASSLIDEQLNKTMGEYIIKDQYNNVKTLWDFVQRQFTCCGNKHFTDWSTILNNTQDLPISCCTLPNGQIGSYACLAKIDNVDLNPNGCLNEFSEYIRAHAVSLGAAGIVIAVLQFFGVLFACYIAREIKIRNGSTGFM